MAIYTYSIASDTASGVLDSSELGKEIKAAGFISFIGVNDENTSDDTAALEFSADLDAAQQATLTALIKSHTGVSTDVSRTCENCQNFLAKT